MDETPATQNPDELGGRARLAGTALAMAALALASPGNLGKDGSFHLAIAAIAIWGVVVSRPVRSGGKRPGRRAFWAEWLPAAAGMYGIIWWMGYTVGPVVLYPAIGLGAYVAWGGVLLRRLSLRLPLALAVPLAWVGLETLRTVVPPPFGLPWMRLGHYAHVETWYAGGARLFGVQGIGFCMALVAGGLAQLVRERRPALPALLALVVGGALPPLAGALVSAPQEEDGPRLLLVQPGVPQVVKKSGGTTDQLHRWGIRTTRAGLAAAEGPIDLVCWGETMLRYDVLAPDLPAKIAAGLEGGVDLGLPWSELAPRFAALERDAVLGPFFGMGRPFPGDEETGRVLPEGASFLAGVLEFGDDDGWISPRNAAVLWDAEGQRAPGVGKIHLVPGAETLYGFARLVEENPGLRDFCRAWVGYIPTLVPYAETGSLPLVTRDGAQYDLGVTVCFDNAFVDPYVDVVRSRDVDFHLVVTNEAWFVESLEFDQMLAFSRLAAIATGRSVVRAANSGISCSIGPDGRERDRLTVDGRDRAVEGALEVVVPVPLGSGAGEPGPRTPFVRTREAWLALWLLLPLAAAFRRPRAVA